MHLAIPNTLGMTWRRILAEPHSRVPSYHEITIDSLYDNPSCRTSLSGFTSYATSWERCDNPMTKLFLTLAQNVKLNQWRWNLLPILLESISSREFDALSVDDVDAEFPEKAVRSIHVFSYHHLFRNKWKILARHPSTVAFTCTLQLDFSSNFQKPLEFDTDAKIEYREGFVNVVCWHINESPQTLSAC